MVSPIFSLCFTTWYQSHYPRACSPAVASLAASLLLHLKPSGSLSCCIWTPPAACIVLHLDIPNSLSFVASGTLQQPLSHCHRSRYTLFIFVAACMPHVVIMPCIIIAAAVLPCPHIIMPHCCTTVVVVATSRALLKP